MRQNEASFHYSMKLRCSVHDYRGRSIYLITLEVVGRRWLLGRIATDLLPAHFTVGGWSDMSFSVAGLSETELSTINELLFKPSELWCFERQCVPWCGHEFPLSRWKGALCAETNRRAREGWGSDRYNISHSWVKICESEFEGMRQEMRIVSYALLQNEAKVELFSCPRKIFLLPKGIFSVDQGNFLWCASPGILNKFSGTFELVLRSFWTSSPLALN